MTISWRQTHVGTFANPVRVLPDEIARHLSGKSGAMPDEDFRLRMQRLRGAKIECDECGLHIAEQPEDYAGKRIHPRCRPLARCYGCDKVVTKGDWAVSSTFSAVGLEPGHVMVHRHPHEEDKPHPTCAQRAQDKVIARKASIEKARRKKDHKEGRKHLMKQVRAHAQHGLKVLVLCPRGQTREASDPIRLDRAALVSSNQHGLISVAFHDCRGTVTFLPNDLNRPGADKVFVLHDPNMSPAKLEGIRNRSSAEVIVEAAP